MKKPLIISLTSGKGGVGKTASNVNIASAFAIKGYKVLLVDLDKQCNTTKYVGSYNEDNQFTITDIIIDNLEPRQAIMQTKVENLDIIPTSKNLENVPNQINLDYTKSREHRLKNLENLTEYDFIFIDNAPDLGILTINSLAISDYVIVPIKPDLWGLEGFSEIIDKINVVKSSYNPRLNLLGSFVTMYSRNNICKSVIEALLQNSQLKYLNASIRLNSKLVESTFSSLPVVLYDQNCTSAKDYISLSNIIEEVIVNG